MTENEKRTILKKKSAVTQKIIADGQSGIFVQMRVSDPQEYFVYFKGLKGAAAQKEQLLRLPEFFK